MSQTIAILDYGMANLRSVRKAFAAVGADATIIADPAQVASADKIVLPGVGAFKDAIATLKSTGLAEAAIRHIERGRPFLGICLGMQMLFDEGHEDGVHKGLGILPGKCIRFDVDSTQNLKVPHMGWNQLVVRRRSPVLRDLAEGASVYFVHSYYVVPDDGEIIATETDYGGLFVSSVWRENIMATQFHPEKSQKAGLGMLANFAGM